jgi:hypothetical protein
MEKTTGDAHPTDTDLVLAEWKRFEDEWNKSVGQPPSDSQLAEARAAEKAHRAARQKWTRAHRRPEAELRAIDVEAFWDELLPDLARLALMNRENPSYGALTDLRDALFEAVWDFGHYAQPLFMQEAMLGAMVDGIKGIYERALCRSDAVKKSWGLHAAAPLTPAERDLQADEIGKCLKELGLVFDDADSEERVLDALVTSADAIRRYRTPEHLAENDEYIEREGQFRGPVQAAAENIGRVLPELLQGRRLCIDAEPLTGVEPLGERSVMDRLARSKRLRVWPFDPVSTAMRAIEPVLQEELSGSLYEEAIAEITDVLVGKVEE